MNHHATGNQDKPLLTTFLQQLNVSRRQLSLYPDDHPQIAASINRTLDTINELFQVSPTITLGIAPDAIFYEELWLDKNDRVNQEFAAYFSSLGIASISFEAGLQGTELVRFNQLLRSDRNTIESFGGFDKLLEQQQINHISVVPIDYDAFQASHSSFEETVSNGEQLWENFLNGLHQGILDFGDSNSTCDLDSVVEIFNEKLVGNEVERAQSAQSIVNFIDNSIQAIGNHQTTTTIDNKLISLLNNLSDEAQQEFLHNAFQALEHHRHAAPEMLQKIPSHLLQNTIAGKNRQELNLSSRLFGLITNLADTSNPEHNHNIKIKTAPLAEDMIRARLDVLFREEQHECFMPNNYQAALQSLLNIDAISTIPDDEKEKLKQQIEHQSVEHNCAAIIFELLEDKIDPDQEVSIQQNLLDLSRFFLDIGDFISLVKIYSNWQKYLYSGTATVSIFDEKVLANHCQLTFLTEVLDATDIWEEDKQPDIAAYITCVGEPYSDLLIERLGLASTWEERKFWMQTLEGIGCDAKQMIINSLGDERWYLVRNLLSIIGKNVDQQSMKRIQKLTTHEHPKVRIEAINCLFFCNPATANRLLHNELQSDDPEALLAAVAIADRSQSLEILAILHKNLASEPADATDLEIKRQTVQTLTKISHRDSLPIFRRILSKQGLLPSKRRKQLQVDIINHLALFSDPAAAKLLQELTTGKHKRLALTALELRNKQLRGVQ